MTLRQAPTRTVIVVVVVLAAITVTGIVWISAWMGALSIGITPAEDLRITDAEFSKGFLTVTVKNTGDTRYDWDVVTVNQVMVMPIRQESHDLNQPIPMSIPIHIGEQASITVGYDWLSGEAYLVTLTSARGNNWDYNTVAP